MPKIIRILRSCSMKIFSTFPIINISKLNFWLVICIAKNFIWTTLKMIFSIFRFFLLPQIPDLQIFASQPNVVNKSIESIFIQLSYTSQKKKMTLWLVLWSRVTNVKSIFLRNFYFILKMFSSVQWCHVCQATKKRPYHTIKAVVVLLYSKYSERMPDVCEE